MRTLLLETPLHWSSENLKDKKSSMQSRRIVITDVGTISALGVGFSNIPAAMALPLSKVAVKDYEFHQLEKEIQCFVIRDFDPVAVLGKKGCAQRQCNQAASWYFRNRTQRSNGIIR